LDSYYDLEDLKTRIANEFQDYEDLESIKSASSFEVLCNEMEKMYAGIDTRVAIKLKYQLSLSEIEDNCKNDTSISFVALIISIFSVTVSATMSFFSMIKGYENQLSNDALINCIFTILIAAFLLIVIFVGNDIYNIFKRKKFRLERQYLKFKLKCLESYF
jgi:hypothetical protein